MKYTVDKGQKGKVKFTFTVSAEEWEKELEAAYQKNKGKYKIQGFRPGHVPKKVIESNYGKMVFFDDAFNDMFHTQYENALEKETDFEVVGHPDIDIVQMEKGITFTAEAEIKPEIKPANYKWHTLKKIERKVADSDIEYELKKAQDKAAREVSVTDRPAQNGDTVTIDYSGSVAGKKFAGGTAEKQPLTLGSNQFIPGFEPQVAGMSIGEKKDITVTFPAEYQEKSLAGKEAVFAVTLHEIKAKELPALDDEFAKDVSEFDTLKAYKADIAKRLQAEFDERASAEMENALIDKIVSLHEVEIPKAMIDSQIDRRIQETEYRLMYQGMRLDDYLKMMGITREELRKDYIEPATKTVKTRLVLEGIIREEKLDVTDKEVDAKIKEMAKEAKKTEKEYREGMRANEIDYIKNDIITKKLTDFLAANNSFSEDAPEVKITKKTTAKPTTAETKLTAPKIAAKPKTAEPKTAAAKKTTTTKKETK